MDVQQIKDATQVLENQMTQLVQAFEASTGCIVHSLPVIPATKTEPVNVRVKVQIGS